ncbi:MAG TPA: DUF1015 domain-containing protein, partial [Candidatus Limnocylindrales bacterium]|nr:DUF1015 domain-containing protein [Candidatus Limnocylindrales bacterium]
MADIRAFRALRYDERVAGALSALICPPYDVISPARHAELEARSPHNFVRVELPDADARGYAGAAQLLGEWRKRTVLRQDLAVALYVHDHEFTLQSQRVTRRGVFAALRLHAPDDGAVLPHEQTFPKAKADRLELLRATRANTSPIFGMVDAGDAIRALPQSGRQTASATADGDVHTLYAVTQPDAIAEFAAALKDKRVYIADGHHRYETAVTYANEQRAPVDAPERWTLVSLSALDDPGLRILATHRLVRGARAALDAAVSRSFDAAPIDRGGLGDVQPGIVLVRDGRFTRLEPRAGVDRSRMPTAWRDLPVAIAEELLLRGVRDAGGEITYEHDTDHAIASAKGDTAAVLIRA